MMVLAPTREDEAVPNTQARQFHQPAKKLQMRPNLGPAVTLTELAVIHGTCRIYVYLAQ